MRTALAALVLAAAGSAHAVAPPSPNAPRPEQRPRLDVAFVLDTTGSMGDEIAVVKEKLVSIAKRLGAGQPRPDVRYAVVAFRDKGDAYRTRVLPFDRDVAKVEGFIRALEADGGGDEPEDVALALATTAKLEWDTTGSVARVAFLVGDAGPQAYAGETGWQKAATNLREKKVGVHTIGCSGLTGAATGVFRTIAERTKGDFEQLTYTRVEKLADGKSRTVLFSGGDTFVADGELKEADWKKGAAALVAEGKAKKEATGGGLGYGGYGAGGGGYASARMAAAPAAAPMAAADVGNNLDEEIASKLVEAAAEAGASYDDD